MQGWRILSALDPIFPRAVMALVKQDQDVTDLQKGNLVFIRRLEEGEKTGEL